MRTTLDLDDDVLQAVKEFGAVRKKTAGQILSELARKALVPDHGHTNVRNGVPLLPQRAGGSDDDRRGRRANAGRGYLMPVALLDVNVLIALFHERHIRITISPTIGSPITTTLGWATCPLTENGLLRILGNPARRGHLHSDQPAVRYLRGSAPASSHAFLAGRRFPFATSASSTSPRSAGHRQVTDVYLLGLAVTHGGRLVTFDQSIPISISQGRDATVAGSHRRRRVKFHS